jgi:hypothetical protein
MNHPFKSFKGMVNIALIKLWFIGGWFLNVHYCFTHLFLHFETPFSERPKHGENDNFFYRRLVSRLRGEGWEEPSLGKVTWLPYIYIYIIVISNSYMVYIYMTCGSYNGLWWYRYRYNYGIYYEIYGIYICMI